MKFIYCLFIIFLLTECGRPPIDNLNYAIVTNINVRSETGISCMYQVKNISNYRDMKMRSKSYFLDACGKYTVGDTIKIVKYDNKPRLLESK